MERILHLNKRPESGVEKIVKKQKKEAHRIASRIKIMKKLELSTPQMEVFETCFAHYLLSKQSRELSYLAKQPEVEIEAKMSNFGKNARELINESEVNDQAIKMLAQQKQTLLNSYPLDDSLYSRSLENAANYVSNIYLNCMECNDKNFKKEFQKKVEYLKTRVLVRKPPNTQTS